MIFDYLFAQSQANSSAFKFGTAVQSLKNGEDLSGQSVVKTNTVVLTAPVIKVYTEALTNTQ